MDQRFSLYDALQVVPKLTLPSPADVISNEGFLYFEI